jgi:2-iminobutanoate/2-iminopropanoate deaminase
VYLDLSKRNSTKKEGKMALKVIRTHEAPAAIGPYSQAIQAGDWVFVSGQIALNPTSGEMVGEDFGEQTRQVLQNLTSILTAAGCAIENVVAVDAFLTDMEQFSTFNAIYETVFSKHRPARAVVEVSALPRGAKVEIKCVACRTP